MRPPSRELRLLRFVGGCVAAIVLSSCGLQPAPFNVPSVPSVPSQAQSPAPQAVTADTPSPQRLSPIAASDYETFCGEMVRQEIVRQESERAELDNHPSSEPAQTSSKEASDGSEASYQRRPLPGLMFLSDVDEAPRGRTLALLGRPCRGDEHLWAVPVPQMVLTTQFGEQRPTLFAVFDGAQFALADGRTVFLAPASEGDFHAALGSYVASILTAEGRATAPLFLMPGGGTFGSAGNLSVPIHQPLGAFHVWQEGGGTWQGYTQGWVGVTDFSGASPRAVGTFLTFANIPCQRDFASSSRHDGVCHGGRAYDLSSIDYPPNGPDELKLTWRMTEFDENAAGLERNVRLRNLTATYVLHGGEYRLLRGEEPPHV